jgi:rhamnogalacturonan endolyase
MRWRTPSKFLQHAAVCAAFLISGATTLLAQQPPVTVRQQGNSYILQNAFVTAEVDKSTGDLKSLKYAGEELMGYVSGHHAGYWEQNPSGAAQLNDGLSIDPATNDGSRAEVYIRGKANGKSLTGGDRGMVCDLEIRYTLGREDHGIYTYAIFSHPASYPATSVGESRFGMKLNGGIFDWLSVDARHNEKMPTGSDWDHGIQMNMKEARRLTTGAMAGRVEHKYDYTADQFDAPAIGWSSTTKHLGIFLINPSQEFLSGGPTKMELTGHLDDGQGGDPTILDYWRSTHYGGSTLDLASGEDWAKVIGPILIYTNSGPTPQAIFSDALHEAAQQASRWPFDWVQDPHYASASQRASVSGRLLIHNPDSPHVGRTLVGLVASGQPKGAWQVDAKHYQFWVDATPDGSFTIPNVRPGTYTLTAIADGIFGELQGPEVTIAAGHPASLGNIAWDPIHYGQTLWEIGIPNRSGSEFFMGDQYNHWAMYLLYAKLFPHDVQYTIGKSDFKKDWYFEQVPHASQVAGAEGMNGPDTTWSIHFNTDGPTRGNAILRAGICGVGARHVFVFVNGKAAGDLAPLLYNATINRDGIQGTWSEHDVVFPASMLHKGDNEIALRIPGGNVTSGIIYDDLRLELDQTGKRMPTEPEVGLFGSVSTH